ncbi:hypothetical protein [Candidatus Nitrosacidococcus tergens]|uniref:Transmembrane protein n=1 Tax=Candidatus Nitrosacidococcus tergens TaxID=553981 RepID=A0A7G1Q997_9GAMM|nr:hypothetical protein [Candidatus Nitrosacidococcus tergens]CAB1275679.1 conserved protein of unknown function [Candidatus Nitrosacidococcus tergens]
MEEYNIWEMVLAGVIALVVILWFSPGIKNAFHHTNQMENKDWKGFLFPIGLVVLFVFFLILVRN